MIGIASDDVRRCGRGNFHLTFHFRREKPGERRNRFAQRRRQRVAFRLVRRHFRPLSRRTDRSGNDRIVEQRKIFQLVHFFAQLSVDVNGQLTGERILKGGNESGRTLGGVNDRQRMPKSVDQVIGVFHFDVSEFLLIADEKNQGQIVNERF